MVDATGSELLRYTALEKPAAPALNGNWYVADENGEFASNVSWIYLTDEPAVSILNLDEGESLVYDDEDKNDDADKDDAETESPETGDNMTGVVLAVVVVFIAAAALVVLKKRVA